MDEIEALKMVDKALSGLDAEDARNRVLEWANAKYGRPLSNAPRAGMREGTPASPTQPNAPWSPSVEGRELPGIAMLSDSGQFQLTVRDPKAISTNDAAARLALVAIYAYCKLTGETSASSRKIVKPVLDSWRAYTGNTRVLLAHHQGIIRNGDALSLDQHAKREAEEYIQEILDDSKQGRWQPAGGRLKRKGNKKAKTENSQN
jgi:hypothetical protein